MAFNPSIADIIAYRAAYICSNPECNTLTIGPSINELNLKNKKGEAAHIIGEKLGSARYDQNSKVDVTKADNGIWLCANCHTLIDKNNGVDYPAALLFEWKKKHEETISMLLHTHKSPMPLIRRQTTNRKVAQNIVDYMSTKGVYYQDSIHENYKPVILSIKESRAFIRKEIKRIDNDIRLKEILNLILKYHIEFMNYSSNYSDKQYLYANLVQFRVHVGMQLSRLMNEIGCNITGSITTIMN